MSCQVKGRFAPSPTGRMHAGNIFSSLIAWLLAKRAGGSIVLRIEDLDTERSRNEYARQVLADYEALGLLWDEGPYFQHDRQSVYEDVFRELDKLGCVYPCFCSRADIRSASAPQGNTIVYPGTCRNLSADKRARRTAELEQQGRDPSWRLMLPAEERSVRDLFQGAYDCDLERECGDIVLRRANGDYAYHLAVVIDDAEQGINQVVRGYDLLASTPVQTYLQETLGLHSPQYAHVPLLVSNEDGHRLAKRHRDASMEALLERYKTPEGILGHIAWVAGLVPDDEPASADSLLRYADLDALNSVAQILWDEH